MQNNLLVTISLALLVVTSLNAEFVSPYADSASQSAEDRLKIITLKSVELQKEIARKEAIAKAERDKAQKIKAAKIAKAKKIKDKEIAENFTNEADLQKTEEKMNNISEAKDIKFKPAPVVKVNAPVNLEDEQQKKDNAFLNSLKNSDTKTMKME